MWSGRRPLMAASPRRQLLGYYLIALGLPVAIVAASLVLHAPDVLGGLREFLAERYLVPNLITISRYAVHAPWAWLILVFAAAPTIAALVVSAASGKFGIRRLLVRLRPLGPGADLLTGLRTYLVILGISVVVIAWYYWWGSRVGDTRAVAFSRGALGGTPILIGFSLAIGHLIDEGGTLEELGWRGFALPRVVELVGSPLSASFVVGFFWWLWHFPREVPGLIAGVSPAALIHDQAVFLSTCLALSVLCTWGWLRTGGSALPAILIHGGSNLWNKALGPTVNPWAGTDVRTLLVVALALLVMRDVRRAGA